MNKPSTIIYRFCQQVNAIFNTQFVSSMFDDERTWLALIEILSHPSYVEHLLFRNYGDSNNYEFICIAGKRYHPEAWTYVTEVLMRKLTLANKLEDKPTSTHDLLVFYFRSSLDQRWHVSTVKRALHAQTAQRDVFFQPIATILQEQCRKLGNQYGEISKRRRLQFGAFWLVTGENRVELAEEMALPDVLQALPLPLAAQPVVPQGLLRLIETLNERYGLLRSCGLPPQHWLNRNDLSMAQLKQLKTFQQMFRQQLESGVERDTALRVCFENLKVDENTFIGFSRFEDFYRFYYAETTVGFQYSDQLDPDALDDIGEQQTDDDLRNFLTDNPQLFNPLTAYVFERLVIDGIVLSRLIKDTCFNERKTLLPEYAALSEGKLLKTLQQQLNEIREIYIADADL